MCWVTNVKCPECGHWVLSLTRQPCNETPIDGEDCGTYWVEESVNRYYGSLCYWCRGNRLIDREYDRFGDRDHPLTGSLVSADMCYRFLRAGPQWHEKEDWPDYGPTKPWSHDGNLPTKWLAWMADPPKDQRESNQRWRRVSIHYLMLTDPLPYETPLQYRHRQWYAIGSQNTELQLQSAWVDFFTEHEGLCAFSLSDSTGAPEPTDRRQGLPD